MEQALAEHSAHNERDSAIRGHLGRIIDFSIRLVNKRLSMGPLARPSCPKWLSLPIEIDARHQDNKTKSDLPRFVESSISDLSRFRYSVNGQVDVVKGGAHVFTIEQGDGSKNGSSIFELMLLSMILSNVGAGVFVVWSDCAAAGRNYFNCVAAAQWLVDNGFVIIVVVGFMQNRHGKFHADLLFG